MKAITALLVLGLAARTATATPDPSRPLRVVTLSTVLTEIASAVGGKEVVVSGLVQSGIDPHTFNPSPADIRAIVDADLVLASGLNLEVYLDRMVASAGAGVRILAVGDGLPAPLSAPPGTQEKDPHWWHGIGDTIFVVDLVRSEFARMRPLSSDVFTRNAAGYVAQLKELQVWVASEVSRLPPARRQLVTSHDAFGYFARDYGFSVHPINGLSTEGEADAKHLAALVDLVRAENIRAIFVESSANPRLVENLLGETGVRLGGTLYADGLGAPGSDAASYVAMYRHNVSAIVSGLVGP
jgi:ABC-type Zn uptake system ZnuABC Zn-binding protein ZnuA